MRHASFGNTSNTYTTALLIKDSSFITSELLTHYVKPLLEKGLHASDLIAFTLEYADMKKVSAAVKKEYLDELLPELQALGVTLLMVNDSEYFKTLTKNVKADPYYGYALDCAIPGFEHMKVILGVNYQALSYNPLLENKLKTAINTVVDCIKGTYVDPGKGIISKGCYPKLPLDIAKALNDLHQYPALTCDIETFSLKFYDAGIGTISFAWNDSEGICFAIDSVYVDSLEGHGRQENQEVKALLKQFLISYQGTLIYHNASFDTKVLIYELWMKNLGDYKGMLEGIEIMTRNFEDTKLIAYLATNNAVKNELSLKVLAQSFAGNYAQSEITDITKIPLYQLIEYNLTDALGTWFVYNKYLPRMIQDNQEDIYTSMFKPSVKLLLQVELVGMPISPKMVQKARETLTETVQEHMDYLLSCPIIKDFHYTQLEEKVVIDNKKLKTKVRTIEEFAHIQFNPGSDQQLQGLIYDYLGYEVIDVTDSKTPATGMKTLAKLINHAKTDEHKLIFENLIGLSKANKILTSFIPAFEKAQQLPDGSWRLYGGFNLGGTQSGRLSSSAPM